MKTVRIFVATLMLMLLLSSSVLAYNTLRMRNNTGKTIQAAYLVNAESDSWGADKLRGYWHDGEIVTFDVSAYRYWLFKIEFTDGQPVYWRKNPIDTSRVSNIAIYQDADGEYRFYNNGKW